MDTRFSLLGLLIIILILAVGFNLLFSAPDYIAVPSIVFLSAALPAALTAGAAYTRGAWRAFCIGGLFPSGLLLYVTGWMLGLSLLEGPGRVRTIPEWVEFSDQVGLQYRTYAGGSWAMIVLIGAMVVLIHHVAHKSV